ncbi:MAG TPA: hypothetical protein VF857_04560 [Spirochaetota bacterium]
MSRKLIMLMVVLLVPFIVGCQLSGEENAGSCRLSISSHGGGFEGFYTIDADDPVTFTQTTPDGGTSFFFFNVDFELPTTIVVTANGLSVNTDSITIRLYKDNKLLKENTVSASNSTIVSIISNTISFDFTTTTTTTTTTGSTTGTTTKSPEAFPTGKSPVP